MSESEFKGKPGGRSLVQDAQDTFGVAKPTSALSAPGKRTLVEQLPLIPPPQNAGVASDVPASSHGAPVQRATSASGTAGGDATRSEVVPKAAERVAGAGGPPPPRLTFRDLFGRQAAGGPKAAESESLVTSDGDAKPPLENRAPHGAQALATGGATEDHVHAAAQRGVAGPGSALPHLDVIQRAFGRHDISGVQAHVGGEAATASRAIGAEAYATGNQVAFAAAPSLHTAAHEAAHFVQQRGGVQLKGGVGEAGDPHERHANDVADAVVQGKGAETLLDQYAAGSSSRATAVQRQEATSGPSPIAATATSAPAPAAEREATSSAAPDAGAPSAAPAVEPATQLTPDDVAELILRRPDSRDDFLQWAERVGGAVYRDKILAAVEKHGGAAPTTPPAPATAASAISSAAAPVRPTAATAAPATGPAATPAPSSPAMTFPTSVRVTSPDGLRVRRTASKESDDNVAGGLHRDAVVTALAREGDWLRIEYQGAPAYVFGGLVAPATAGAGTAGTSPVTGEYARTERHTATTPPSAQLTDRAAHAPPVNSSATVGTATGHATSPPSSASSAAIEPARSASAPSASDFTTASGNAIAKTTAKEAEVLNRLRREPKRFDPVWLATAQHNLNVTDATGAFNTETLRAMRTRASRPTLDVAGIMDETFLASIAPGSPFHSGSEIGTVTQRQPPAAGATSPKDRVAQDMGYASFLAYRHAWGDDAVTFLGHSLRTPAHQYLRARLRVAETYLRNRVKSPDGQKLDDLGIMKAIGWSGAGNASYSHDPMDPFTHQHAMGLAIDIDPGQNPYFFDHSVTNADFWVALFEHLFRHATKLFGGEPLTAATLAQWSRESSTEELFQRVSTTSQSFAQLIALSARAHGDETANGEISRKLAQAGYEGETLKTAVHEVAVADHHFHQQGGRADAKAATNLTQEMVIALRDVAGLAWGGTEMSTIENADFMHFDCRLTDYGSAVYDAAHRHRGGH